MATKTLSLVFLASFVAVAGCASESASSAPVVTAASRLPAALDVPKPRTMSREESALIDTISALHPESADMMKRLLTDRRVASVGSEDPNARALMARLDSLRQEQARARYAAHFTRIPAGVMIASELSDTAADAMVLRRPASKGGDLIVLHDGPQRVRELAMAVRTLQRMRRQYGDQVTGTGMKAVLHSSNPRQNRWSPEVTAQAQAFLDEIQTHPTVDVPGVGRGKVGALQLLPSPATQPGKVGALHVLPSSARQPIRP